ncbi:RDD family protein [Moraxella sp. Tifton1]|uniref:RDD family protein n=1 Tax=Moraxella oculi TaxID=2940516 RepID=UPI00201294FA|nr:RDD family protein [Moraxella sp. Tifton1]MCL1622649.1 RDD family protein [Moraxella sp. Tifton1]
MKIFLARNKVQAGPYTLEEVNIMLSSGAVVLDDLMWHSGMNGWQKIGDVTGGQLSYQPNTTNLQSANQSAQPSIQRGFGDNVEFKTHADKRVSVDELYGRQPINPAKPNPSNSLNGKVHHPSETVYASIGSRFLALAINMTLFLVAFMPFISGLMKLNPDRQLMTTGSFEARMAYAKKLAEQLPSQVTTMTLLLLGGFFIVQLMLIVMRGQSFGKLVTGIRVLDAKTGQLPSLGSLLGMRTMLLVVIYWLASVLPFNIAFLLLGVHYFMAASDHKKQGWHDRIAKTVVVKASPDQLNKKQ